MGKEKKSFSTVRESITIEIQVQEQLRAYRNARNLGHLQGMENTISGLFDILGPWIPPEDKIKYLAIRYVPLEITAFYTAEDYEDVMNYGELEECRIKELKKIQQQHNRKEFYATCDKRIGILMETFKKLGLGFQEEEVATIHPDKKKVIYTAKPY